MNLVRTTLAVAMIVASALPAEAIPADPDPTFSDDGRTVIEIASAAEADAVAMQGTNIVVGGTREVGPWDMVIARLTPRGAVDTTFSKDGSVSVKASAYGDWLEDLVVAPDGKIVAAGGVFDEDRRSGVLVVRLKPNGALDPTFGGDGIVITTLPGTAYAATVALTPDGKIVVGGGLRRG